MEFNLLDNAKLFSKSNEPNLYSNQRVPNSFHCFSVAHPGYGPDFKTLTVLMDISWCFKEDFFLIPKFLAPNRGLCKLVEAHKSFIRWKTAIM